MRVTSTSTTSVTLRWAPPNDGGGTVEAYNVYRCEQVPGEAPCTPVWIAWVTRGTSFTDTHDDSSPAEAGGTSPVEANKTYRYAVAGYRILAGNRSTQITAVAKQQLEILTAPSAPVDFTARGSDSKITLSWKEPWWEGSRRFESFTLYRAVGDSCEELSEYKSDIPASTRYLEAPDVTTGQDYCYQLTATNLFGESPPSDAQTVAAVDLGNPRDLSVTTGNTAVIGLSWTAPPDDGGGPVDGYDVYRCEQTGTEACVPTYVAWVVDGEQYRDLGLTKGTTYRYAVDAVRADIVSEKTNEVTFRLGSAAVVRPGTFEIMPVTVVDGAKTTTEIISILSDSGVPAGTLFELPTIDASLNLWDVNVTSENAEGSLPGAPSGLVHAADRVLTIVLGKRGGGYIKELPSPATLCFPLSQIADGVDLGSAAFYQTGSDGHMWTAMEAVRRPGMVCGAIRQFTRFAVFGRIAEATTDPDSESETTPEAEVTGPRFAEDANIGELMFTAGVAIDSITLPQATGGDIDATLNNGELSVYSFDPADLPEGLTFDRFTRVLEGTPTQSLVQTAYTYWVHDDDEDYSVEDADSLSFTMTIEAGETTTAPTGLIARADSSRVVLSWTAPMGTVTSYTLYRGDGNGCDNLSSLQSDIAADAISAEDTAITTESTYCYAVSAANDDGEGSQSATTVVKAVTVGEPTGLTVTSTGATAISLSWTAPANDDGGPVEAYNVYRCQDDETSCELTDDHWIAWVDDGTTFTDTHDDSTAHERGGTSPVVAGTAYRYAVAAYRSSEGNWSNEVTVTAQTGSGETTDETTTGPKFADDASIGDLAFTTGVAIEPITLPRATGGHIDSTLNDGELSDYSFDPADLPAGLTFDRFTRVMQGTPTQPLEKTNYTFWVHDDDEDYAVEDADSLGFTITVEGESIETEATGPRFEDDASIGDLMFTVGEAIEPTTLPRATGGDIDATLNDGELSVYSFDPVDLPAGLTFDRFTRVMRGTPTQSLEKTNYTYWVHDDDEDYSRADSDSIGFTITIVAASGNAPQLLSEADQVLLEDVSASMARSMLSSLVPTISSRFTASSESQFSLAGRQLTMGEIAERVSADIGHTSAWAGNSGFSSSLGSDGLPQNDSSPSTHRIGATPYADVLSGAPGASALRHNQVLSGDRLLLGSGFATRLAADREKGREWMLWGRSDIQAFQSNSVDGGEYSGDVRTGYLGLDGHIGERAVIGVSLAHSLGQAEYSGADSAGTMEMEVTTVLPYARFAPNRQTEAWIILGAGQGERRTLVDGQLHESGELAPKLGAVGGRRKFESGIAGIDWEMRGDVEYMSLMSVYDMPISANRARFGLEGSSTLQFGSDAFARPFLEVGVRYDEGAGRHTGAGVELVGGVLFRHAGSGFWLEARGRSLVLHATDDYEETGFSLTAGLQPRTDGTGLSLLLSPRWGGMTESSNAIWRDHGLNLAHQGRGMAQDKRSMRAEFAYGFLAPRSGAMVQPFGEVQASGEFSRRARLGARYRHRTESHHLELEVSSDVATGESLNHAEPFSETDLQYDFALRGNLRF